MAKTYSNLVSEARVLLQDTDADLKRYSDTKLIDILNRGLQDLARIRPDSMYDLYVNNDLMVPELVESSPGGGQTVWTANFGLGMQFYSPLVSYLVGVAEIVDDEYTEEGRAAFLLGQFRNSVVGI
ncbi:hypothetical protein LCGC14_1217160 [marine sediment metagenome]|uniref:Uncharacterized protein n=1 Tax=marine sediment metagenome TaxID=412755 RepID=A0A0F9LGE5_9ZZZZ